MFEIMSWFTESNRWKHFLFAIPASLILTVFFGLGLGAGMEFKDYKYGQGWDWLDFLATALGSFIGGGLQVLIIWLAR